MKTAMSEMKTLKSELEKTKTESSLLLATEEKSLMAEEGALSRAMQQKEVLNLKNFFLLFFWLMKSN